MMSNIPTSAIQTGEVAMKKECGWQENGKHGYMAMGNGWRSSTTYVKFDEQFVNPPKIFIALKSFDISCDRGEANRIIVEAEDVTIVGFNAKFTTWAAGTHIWGVGASWIAFQ